MLPFCHSERSKSDVKESKEQLRGFLASLAMTQYMKQLVLIL